MKKTLSLLTSFIILFFMGLSLVFAQGPGGEAPTPPGGDAPIGNVNVQFRLTNPFRNAPDSLFGLLETVINDILLPIGGVVAVLSFIYSGFLYVTAQGRESQLATAHKALLYTSIGTAVLLGSWVLANVIKATIERLM